jgi:hypothetical protein
MATRVIMRTWLRRRLQETTADQWSDATLNYYLNEGLHFMQQEIEKLEPEAFIYEDTANIVSAQRLYAWPSNMKREVEVKVKVTSTATEYTILKRRDRRTVNNPLVGTQSTQANTYAHQGRYLLLQATPTANVTDGIWLTYVPVLEMGADSDVPNIPVDIHIGIVLAAQLYAFGDSSGSSDKQEVKGELADVIIRLPMHYSVSGGEPPHFRVSDHYKSEPSDMDDV